VPSCDAPPTIEPNIEYLIYSYHHADHLGASSLFGNTSRASATRRYVVFSSATTIRLGRQTKTPGRVPVYVSNLTGISPATLKRRSTRSPTRGSISSAATSDGSGMRDDVLLHQNHMAGISESSRKAIGCGGSQAVLRPLRCNEWPAAKGRFDETTGLTAAPVIEKYTGVLAGADLFAESTAFWVMESIRFDLGYGSQVHP
jgi:hypothetical protein